MIAFPGPKSGGKHLFDSTHPTRKLEAQDGDGIWRHGPVDALAPVTLGTTRISVARDPDGDWIELSQRASIVGSLN